MITSAHGGRYILPTDILGRRGRYGESRFTPIQVSAVTAWYRLAASTPVSSEWETVVDVLGGASITQTDADRKLAVGAAANGLPTGVYDGTDCMRMPLGANNYSTSKFGIAWWANYASGSMTPFAIYNNDAGNRTLAITFSGTGQIIVSIYIGTNVDGRAYATPTSVWTPGSFGYPRFQFDSSKTNECDTNGSTTDAKVRFFYNETAIALTPSDIGAGGTLSALRTVSGAAIIGGLNDSDTPAGAVVSGSLHGPNTFILLDTPTATQAANLMNFEVPT